MKHKAFKIDLATLFIYKHVKNDTKRSETDTTTVFTTTNATTGFNK